MGVGCGGRRALHAHLHHHHLHLARPWWWPCSWSSPLSRRWRTWGGTVAHLLRKRSCRARHHVLHSTTPAHPTPTYNTPAHPTPPQPTPPHCTPLHAPRPTLPPLRSTEQAFGHGSPRFQGQRVRGGGFACSGARLGARGRACGACGGAEGSPASPGSNPNLHGSGPRTRRRVRGGRVSCGFVGCGGRGVRVRG